VTDIALPTAPSPELQRVEWLDGATGPALGARFAGDNHNEFIGDWRTVCEITELAPEQTFTWAVMDAYGRFGPPVDDPAHSLATWRFTLTPTETGTLLRQSVRVGPGASGLSTFIARMPDKEATLIAARLSDLHTAMTGTLTTIKTQAES
jgi:hypothetical protein